MAKIGLLVIATGKYDQFIPPLYKSMKKYFMKNHEVTMFVFTDKEMPKKEDLICFKYEHESWPSAALKKYNIICDFKDFLIEMDYLYLCDADMLFVDFIGDEILPDTETGLVATEHPGFYGGRRGTYENNPKSTSCVLKNEGKIYFAGAFNGGKTNSFLEMSENIKNNVNVDLSNNIIALWHDESHINRYFIDNKPKVLNPSYCYPESWNLPFDKKLLALDKNHNEIRS